MKKVDILVIPLNKIIIGIYHKSKLIKKYSEDDKCSVILPVIFSKIMNNYKIDSIIYANSPGTFMAMKITYIFVKTLQIIDNNIKIYSVDAFMFNNNNPIKALNKLYFIKNNNKIETKIITNYEKNDKSEFKLPLVLKDLKQDNDIKPTYNISYI